MQATTAPNAAPAWRLQDAKAQFSALIDNAMRGVPQHVTRRGKQAVVVLSEQDFQALQRTAAGRTLRPVSLIDHLLAIPKAASTATAQPKAAPTGQDADFADLDLQPREIDFS